MKSASEWMMLCSLGIWFTDYEDDSEGEVGSLITCMVLTIQFL